MGQLNIRNYYSFQDLDAAFPLVKKMLKDGCRYLTVYSTLRGEARWLAIGDWSIISLIFRTAKENGHAFTKKAVRDVLRKAENGEFKNISS